MDQDVQAPQAPVRKPPSMLVLFFVILLTAVLASFGTYYILNKQFEAKLETYKVNQTQNPKPTVQEKTNESSNAAEEFVTYSNQELGFTFSYPKEWGSLEKTVNPNQVVYSAGFSSTKVPDGQDAISGSGGYNIVLYGNSGKQDLTQGGRGGSTVGLRWIYYI